MLEGYRLIDTYMYIPLKGRLTRKEGRLYVVSVFEGFIIDNGRKEGREGGRLNHRSPAAAAAPVVLPVQFVLSV